MRVTSSMLINNFVRNMQINLRRLEQIQDTLASGKKLRRPSDDPVGVVDSLSLRSDLGEYEQYISNIEDARTWMEVTDSALDNATEVLQRARELALYGANDTLPQESRNALAREVEQLRDQLVLIANTTLGGRYVFGGTQTEKPPADSADPKNVQWEGNEENIEYEVAPGVTLPVNCNGKFVFTGSSQGPNAFDVLNSLASALGDPRNIGEIDKIIGEIDEVIDRIIETRGELGARINRAEMALDRMQQQQIKQIELLASAEDADIAETIVDLKAQENVYRVCLATGARIIMPTLIDFLR
ncbi:MAG: Flagellar hook protein 3 [Thermoanaerobacterales bacterium 50_218]|nr:MAG: Flagellar hook protein 3 [Thermoanaerobacterales bacterium 50_218]